MAYKAQRLASKRGTGDQGPAVSPAAVNRPLMSLRHLLRQARRWKLITEVPEIELEKEPQGRPRWLEPAEAQRLLAARGRPSASPGTG